MPLCLLRLRLRLCVLLLLQAANVLILFGWWIAAVSLLLLSVVSRNRVQQDWMRAAKLEEQQAAKQPDIEQPAAAQDKAVDEQLQGKQP